MTTEVLRKSYAKQLRMYIASRIEGSAVDDILQQAFLKVHSKIDTIQETKATRARLYRITQNTIIDRYRKEYGDKNGHMDDIFRNHLEEDKTQSNEKKIIKNISSCLLPMIDNLDKQSKLVMKRYVEPGVSQKTIAKELGLSLSNVKVIIHRAKGKLKEMYDQCCYQYRDDKGNLIDTRCSKNCGCENSTII